MLKKLGYDLVFAALSHVELPKYFLTVILHYIVAILIESLLCQGSCCQALNWGQEWGERRVTQAQRLSVPHRALYLLLIT